MSFFRQFPEATYDILNNGALTRITDIFRNVTSRQLNIPSDAFATYHIVNGARPDVVSQIIYGDPDYYWTFFMINDALKIGHAGWPMTDTELESFLSREYDAYSVIQMCDNDEHVYELDGVKFSTTVAADSGSDLDFSSNLQYVVDLQSGASRRVMKYDPAMQQIWLYNSGSSDTFIDTLKQSGSFRFSTQSSYPFTLATVSSEGNLYDTFYPVRSGLGNQIASPGILPYISAGRNAIHHYAFVPAEGDYIELGYRDNDGNFQGIKGKAIEILQPTSDSYGSIKLQIDNGNFQYHYFKDDGFTLTVQDVHKVLIYNLASDTSASTDSNFKISPINRIIPVTHAEWEYSQNEQKSTIRIVNSTQIRAFTKQYRDLLNNA